MKVVVALEVSPVEGGGFYQALNAVTQMQRLCAGRYEFAVAYTNLANKPVLDKLGIDSFYFPASRFERLQPLLSASRLVDGILRKCLGPSRFERALISAGADLVYFVSPSWRAGILMTLCYWITVWDMAHVEYPEFPEVARRFHARESALRQASGSAAVIVADSPTLSLSISHRYGVALSRVVAMPFAPAATLDAECSAPCEDVLRRFGLEAGYLFYPAQFWAHKNHVRILESLQLCNERGRKLTVVFAGGDMGQRSHIEAMTRSMGLQAQVRFLGFVDARDMRGLYQGSRALVMPTYFGPTNLPPLEAWTLGVPVIYSRHLSEQVGDAALLADPDDAAELADCMLKCFDDDLCAGLIARGKQRLREIDQQRREAEAVLADRLRRFEARLRCSG